MSSRSRFPPARQGHPRRPRCPEVYVRRIGVYGRRIFSLRGCMDRQKREPDRPGLCFAHSRSAATMADDQPCKFLPARGSKKKHQVTRNKASQVCSTLRPAHPAGASLTNETPSLEDKTQHRREPPPRPSRRLSKAPRACAVPRNQRSQRKRLLKPAVSVLVSAVVVLVSPLPVFVSPLLGRKRAPQMAHDVPSPMPVLRQANPRQRSRTPVSRARIRDGFHALGTSPPGCNPIGCTVPFGS